MLKIVLAALVLALPSFSHADEIKVTDYGAVFDGVTDDTVAFQKAIAALPNGGTILVPMGSSVISQNLVSNQPILIKSDVRGDISSNTNGSAVGSKPAIRWIGAAGGVMYTIQPATAGNVVWGGGSDGIEWDGQGVAAVGVNLDSTKYALFDGKVKGFTWAGVVLSSVSGSTTNFSMKNHIRSLEFVWGYTVASRPSHGLVLRGNGSNVPATQQLIGDVSGLVYDGDLIQINETDNAQIVSVHGVINPNGSGSALNIKNAGAQPSNHTVVNYAVGPVKLDSGVIGTKFEHYNSEAGGISGSSLYDGQFIDYVSGAVFKSHTYALRKKIELTAADFRPLARAPMTTADFGLQWNTLTFPDGYTSIASAVKPTLYDMESGVIEGVEVLYGSNSAGGGNVRFQVYLSTVTNGSLGAVVTPEKNIVVTAPVGVQYAPNSYTVSFSPELPFTKGDHLYLSITRLGADGLDSNTASIHLLGARILYRSTGPSSAGSGAYYIPQW